MKISSITGENQIEISNIVRIKIYSKISDTDDVVLEEPRLTPDKLEHLYIIMEDFEKAIKKVHSIKLLILGATFR